MDNVIKNLLEFDPLLHAEKAFNKKDYHDFNDEENASALGLAILHNEKKDKMLKELNDTHWSMTWEEFINLMIKNNFKIGYEEEFDYEDRKEKAMALYRLEDGLIIWVTSYNNMSTINYGKLYGEIILHDKSKRFDIPACSNGFYDYDNSKLMFDTDIREGLLWFIRQMEKFGTFIPQWEEPKKFLWFLNYGEDEKHSKDYVDIARNKMQLFNDEAKHIVKKYL